MPKSLLQINTVINSGSTGRIAEEIGHTAMAAGSFPVDIFYEVGENPVLKLVVYPSGYEFMT